MDPKTAKFLAFVVFSLFSLGAGYAARRRGWTTEHASRPLHFWTLVLLWSPVSLMGFWGLPLRGEAGRHLIEMMLCQPVLMVLGACAALPLAKWAGCDRARLAVILSGSGISNHGFTLGAYLCYALLNPGELALRYAIAYVTSMQVFVVLIFYPIAHAMAPREEGAAIPGTGQVIRESFLSLRAMPLYAAAVGAVMQWFAVPVPGEISGWHLLDVLFFGSAAASYAGIGLRLRVGDVWSVKRLHGILAGIHFMVMPLLAWGLLWALAQAGAPLADLPHRVILLEAFTPVGINVVIIANLFHLDARLGSVLWLVNTLLFCVLVVPLLIWLVPGYF